MLPKRLSVKFFATEESEIDFHTTFAVFQKWIQQETVEGLLIDVVDYKHVHHGPGVILIADEGDYGLDISDGKPGLLYVRKRQIEGDLADVIKNAIRLSALASKFLSDEEALQPLDFDYNTVQVTLLDRLNLPNTAETLALVRDEITALFKAIYGEDGELSIALATDDPREAFSLLITSNAGFTAETFLARLSDVETVKS